MANRPPPHSTTRMLHSTAPQKLPRRLRHDHADIDQGIAPLIDHLWRLGFRTRYCCQGDADQDGYHVPGGEYGTRAYITFGSMCEAALFVALAGPSSWDDRTHRQRHAEDPKGTERWTWDWRLEGDVVRFPARDITRATRQLAQARWRLDRFGALLATRHPLPGAPDRHDPDPMERVGAPQQESDALPAAPQTCPTCGTVVLSRRSDARYCSRRCQLRARDRRAQ